MLRGAHFAALVAATAVALAAPTTAAPATPVPSLQPQATAKLWKSLVDRRHLTARTADCQRLVFYAESDWLRLATKLAANQAPCAQYYISIPPLAADKTNFRPDQPWRIRALGSNFHPMAQISYTGWSSWVTATGATWYAAGVEARKRMAAQGFDVAAGDIWVVNESSSAVRTGTGNARRNLRDLVRGLYDAGTGPNVKGAVFVVGVGQSATSLSTYKGTLQIWFGDSAFWSDMSAYVSDWSQELYGDIRNYAVPGAPPETRRDQLNAWLQHPMTLVRAGADEVATARSFLASAYSPLANAAWRYAAGAGFGWTDVPFDQMQDYVSAQTYALGSAGSHFGLAWAPNRPDTVTTTQFATESGAVLDRLAAAIRDSAAACTGTCTNSIDGTRFNEGWKDFATWTTPSVIYANEPPTLTAGTPAGPLTVRLQLAGVTRADTQPVTVTLATSSSQGGFATGPTGPWTSTLSVEIPTGSTDATFYYRDTKAGTVTLSASAPGRAGAEQVATVAPAALDAITVSPANATLAPGQKRPFSATGADAYGNAVPSPISWAATSGTLSPVTGPATTFTAGRPGTVTITARSGTLIGAAVVTVAAPLRVAGVRYAVKARGLLLTLTVVDARRRRVARAAVRFALKRNGRWAAAGAVRTNARGAATFVRPVRRGCYTIKIARITAPGFAWNLVTPKNGFCVTARARSAAGRRA
jgi:hypothetical protein